jgi:hypothetical protein
LLRKYANHGLIPGYDLRVGKICCVGLFKISFNDYKSKKRKFAVMH